MSVGKSIIERMFEDGGSVGDGPSASLSVGAVLGFCAFVGPGPVAMGWLAALDAAVLPAGERVQVLACWEAQAAWVAGCQARALAAMDAPDGPPGPGDEDWVREEVAAALHLSAVTADRRLQVARALTHRLPGTRDALGAGLLDHRKAAAIAEATEPLDPAVAAARWRPWCCRPRPPRPWPS